MNLEKIKPISRALLLSAPLFADAFTGCASSKGSDKPPTAAEKAIKEKKEIEESPVFEATYYPNGTRLLEYKNVPETTYFPSILEICDGLDPVDQTDVAYHSGIGGSNRSVGHPACADGKLTAEDFEIKLPLADN